MRGFAEVSWLDGDNLDVELSELLPEDGGGALHGVLRCAVDRQTRVAVQTGHAAHVNDAT